LTHVLFAWQAKVIGKFGSSEIVFAGRRQTLDALSSTWQAQESVHVADALATVDQNKGCFHMLPMSIFLASTSAIWKI